MHLVPFDVEDALGLADLLEGAEVVRSTDLIGAYALDADGRVVLVSPMTEGLSGYDFTEIRHHHYLEYVPPERAAVASEHFRRAMSGERIEGDAEFVAAGGVTVKIGFTAQPDHDASGTVIGITGTVWLDG